MHKITLLKGDGIGPEIVNEAVKTIDALSDVFNFKVSYQEGLIGGCAYDAVKNPLPEDTLNMAKDCDAVLLGAVGDTKYDTLSAELRPERALLKIRKELNVFANLRPATIFEELIDSCPLKAEIAKGVDLLIVRELLGDLYFGAPRGIEVNINEDGIGERVGFNTMAYSESQIKQIAHVAFQAAQKRGKKLCSVDKANILETSQLWRELVNDISKEYKDVTLEHMYVDNCAMQLISNPTQFDVILTGNMFGDILSDEASMLSGSLGLLPSASLSDGKTPSLYEPIHGSAPDIKNQNIANPIATILSVAMMFKYSLNNNEAHDLIYKVVKDVLKEGYRTKDIYSNGTTLLGTKEMGDLIAGKIKG